MTDLNKLICTFWWSRIVRNKHFHMSWYFSMWSLVLNRCITWLLNRWFWCGQWPWTGRDENPEGSSKVSFFNYFLNESLEYYNVIYLLFTSKILWTSKIFKFSTEDHEHDLSFYLFITGYITFLNGQKKLLSDNSYQINPYGGRVFFHSHHGNGKVSKWE